MPDFFSLSRDDQREALLAAADQSGRPVHLLEKDVWVVWALQHLFTGPQAPHLVFKGGTSLSKAHGMIRRFSEDVDLTYDIRVIAPELDEHGEIALPKTRSQAKKWTRTIQQRLTAVVQDQFGSEVKAALEARSLPAVTRIEGDKLYIDYEPLSKGTGYVSPSVLLEFGARATGEPCELMPVTCDAAEHIREVTFPDATPRVMRAERTFWEKATAIHVYCASGQFRGSSRFARHWHDLTRLDAAGVVARAAANRDLANQVATHKAVFFAEKTAVGEPIDYTEAVNGGLKLVPSGDALRALADDYAQMVADGLLLDDAEAFEELLEKCRAIAGNVNAIA